MTAANSEMPLLALKCEKREAKGRGGKGSPGCQFSLRNVLGFNAARDKTLRKQKQQKRTNIVFKEAWLSVIAAATVLTVNLKHRATRLIWWGKKCRGGLWDSLVPLLPA